RIRTAGRLPSDRLTAAANSRPRSDGDSPTVKRVCCIGDPGHPPGLIASTLPDWTASPTRSASACRSAAVAIPTAFRARSRVARLVGRARGCAADLNPAALGLPPGILIQLLGRESRPPGFVLPVGRLDVADPNRPGVGAVASDAHGNGEEEEAAHGPDSSQCRAADNSRTAFATAAGPPCSSFLTRVLPTMTPSAMSFKCRTWSG